MCLTSYENNNGADQPAHPRSLISAFVVHCLDSIISLDSIAEISRLASFCGCAGRFVSGLVKTPKDTICHVLAHVFLASIMCKNDLTPSNIKETWHTCEFSLI